MALLLFYVIEEDIQEGIVEWLTHLKLVPNEEMEILKPCTKRNQDCKLAEAAWLHAQHMFPLKGGFKDDTMSKSPRDPRLISSNNPYSPPHQV
jgi:hypothetical protein